MNIGDRIRRKREELGMSQEELAKKMGYTSRNSIYKYEQMDNMKLSMVQKFADVLDVDPSYLMGWEDEEREHKYKFNIKAFGEESSPTKESLIQAVNELSEEQATVLLQTVKLLLGKS